MHPSIAIINAMLCVFLLFLLCDQLSFIMLSVCGICVGYLLYSVVYGYDVILYNNMRGVLFFNRHYDISIQYIWMIIVGIIFSRNIAKILKIYV